MNRPRLPSKMENGDYPAYAWPGGYPILYYTKDGGTLCPQCANDNKERINDPDDAQYYVTGFDTYDEGPDIQCDDCGTMVASSYGDPEHNKWVDRISDLTRHAENPLTAVAPNFATEYLNPYDNNNRLVTDEGCELVLNELMPDIDYPNDDPATLTEEQIIAAIQRLELSQPWNYELTALKSAKRIVSDAKVSVHESDAYFQLLRVIEYLDGRIFLLSTDTRLDALCDTCKVKGHDTCSLTAGCPCCDNTIAAKEQE